MSGEIIAVIVGGMIGILGSLGTTFITNIQSNKRRSKSIKIVVKAEITFIKEKSERILKQEFITKEELVASMPMLTSISGEIGFLSESQAINFRRVVTLFMEIREIKLTDENIKAKLRSIIEACHLALKSFL